MKTALGAALLVLSSAAHSTLLYVAETSNGQLGLTDEPCDIRHGQRFAYLMQDDTGMRGGCWQYDTETKLILVEWYDKTGQYSYPLSQLRSTPFMQARIDAARKKHIFK